MRCSWIPSYLRDFQLSGLMRTTSRLECEDYVFSKFLHPEANFLDFIVSFGNAMEKQRHNQCLLDHQSLTTNSIYKTFLPIKIFKADVYTRSNFFIVQNEIFNSIWSCFHLSVIMENEVEVYLIKDKKKSPWKDVKHKSVDDGENYYSDYPESLSNLSPSTDFKEIDIIPSKYKLRRWRKNIIPPELLIQTFSNSGKESKMIQDAFVTFGSIINKLANEEHGLRNFLSNLQEYLSEVNKCGSSMSSCSM
ncbi:uncharacterized protein LOC111893734 [Lactuca sativa]|uniref:uncharacterized protein LOC111893734 n=1 Tax=Lactuca sativa TaxID=4236 RepID=UPI000CD882D6|nr:uncharacterized protein LOC111893734 [Lactuca sativa]